LTTVKPSSLPTLDELIELVNRQALGGSDLDKIPIAESMAYDLEHVADELTNHFVEKARAAGHSWSQIGTQLGMSKQGAQQRYQLTAREEEDGVTSQILWLRESTDDPRAKRSTEAAMRRLRGALQFQRFTHAARNVVTEAQAQARELGHSHIGVEHILLGILAAGQDPAAQVLNKLGVDFDAVRARVVDHTGPGRHSGRGHLPFTKDAKKALELALRESIRLGNNYIGSEHVLLGLVRADNMAVELLGNLGVTKDQITEQVTQLLSKP
jgi:hypothetical protein